MFITLGALAVSAVGAVFIANRATSKDTVKVVQTPINNMTLVEENSKLANALIDELERIKTSPKKNPAELDLVVQSFVTIIRTAWPAGTYYDKSSVTPFLNILNASCAVQREISDPSYCITLSNTIREFVPKCSEALLRGETGDHVTDFTYAAMKDLDNKSRYFNVYIHPATSLNGRR